MNKPTDLAVDDLPFTGERFVPGTKGEIWIEHWHRYHFAARWAAGKRVLDVACGEGYGTALLARVARARHRRRHLAAGDRARAARPTRRSPNARVPVRAVHRASRCPTRASTSR